MSERQQTIITVFIAIVAFGIAIFCWSKIIARYESFENRITALEAQSSSCEKIDRHRDRLFCGQLKGKKP